MKAGATLSPEEISQRLERLDRSRDSIQAQARRVDSLIAEMNASAEREAQIANAHIAFLNGDWGALRDTAIGPTPEQLAHAPYQETEARLDHHQAPRLRAYRRVLMPQVVRLHLKRVIEHEHLIACRWYHDCHEATGTIGAIPSTDYGKEIFAAPQSRDMFTAFQLEAQMNFATVRAAMTAQYLPFFDAVVLRNQGPSSAIRLARRRKAMALATFRQCADELLDAYGQLKRG